VRGPQHSHDPPRPCVALPIVPLVQACPMPESRPISLIVRRGCLLSSSASCHVLEGIARAGAGVRAGQHERFPALVQSIAQLLRASTVRCRCPVRTRGDRRCASDIPPTLPALPSSLIDWPLCSLNPLAGIAYISGGCAASKPCSTGIQIPPAGCCDGHFRVQLYRLSVASLSIDNVVLYQLSIRKS
jgi:hypothetical protein